MEIIYLIIFFIGPGIFVKEISRYFSVVERYDPPKIDKLKKIADYFGVPIEFFLEE